MKHWNPRAENDPVDRTKEVKAYESDLANLLKANTSSHAEIVAIAAADVVAQADYFETFFTFGTGLTYSTEIGLVRLGHPLQQLVEDIASRITDLEAWDRRHGEALRLKVQRFEAKAKIAAAHMERDGLGFRLIRVAPSPHGLLGGCRQTPSGGDLRGVGQRPQDDSPGPAPARMMSDWRHSWTTFVARSRKTRRQRQSCLRVRFRSHADRAMRLN